MGSGQSSVQKCTKRLIKTSSIERQRVLGSKFYFHATYLISPPQMQLVLVPFPGNPSIMIPHHIPISQETVTFKFDTEMEAEKYRDSLNARLKCAMCNDQVQTCIKN